MSSVRVTVVNRSGATAASAVTDSTGQFIFRLPTLGPYRVRAARIGYTTHLTEAIVLDSTFADNTTVLLPPRAVPLETLTVKAEGGTVVGEIPWLADDGFYDRRRKGVGYFLTRPDIEAKSPIIMSDVLQGIPGVHVTCGASLLTGCGITMPAATSMFVRGKCQPSVVLDGVVVSVGGTGGVGSVDGVSPFNIEAVEVYTSPVGIPVQYSGYISPCGAILLWSRR